jgi:flagellar hook-length control protein FliK
MMQRIATSQSDVATLPVNIGGNEASSGQANHGFRDMLESHKQPRPEVARPVDPIASETDKAVKGKVYKQDNATQASLDQKNTEVAEHTIDKDIDSPEQRIDDDKQAIALSQKGSEEQTINNESQTSNVDESADTSTTIGQGNKIEVEPQHNATDKGQQQTEALETTYAKNTETQEIDWLTLLGDIEYVKSNHLKAANAAQSFTLAEDAAQSIIAKTTNSETGATFADGNVEGNVTNSQKDMIQLMSGSAENNQVAISTLATNENEESDLNGIQQTIANIGQELELSGEDQALLADLTTLIERYQQSEEALQTSIEIELKPSPVLAEVTVLDDASKSKTLLQEIEQLVSQFLVSQQRQAPLQEDAIEIDLQLQQQSVVNIDRTFLVELLAEAVTEKTVQASPAEVDLENAEQLDMQQQSVSEATDALFELAAEGLDSDLTLQQQNLPANSSSEDIPSSSVSADDMVLNKGSERFEAVDIITQFDGLEQEIILQSDPAEQQAIEPKEVPLIQPKTVNMLGTLASLSENKLDLALRNLAKRIDELTQQSNENDITQQAAVSKASGAIETPSNTFFQLDFVKSLKQGVEDFKQKIKVGMQSSADLNTLVADALNSAAALHKTAEIPPQQIDQVLSTFNTTLDSGLRLSSALEQVSLNSPQQQRSMAREVTQQTQFEHVKQVQQQILGHEKAIHITRSEGHQQLVEKVRWMVNQNNLQADIRMDPPDLGSVKVRVNLAGETASVNFIVQSQQARDALEQAAPRLKELLDEQGIELGQSSVQQEQKESQQEQQNFADGSSNPQPSQLIQSTVIEQPIINGRLGAIDYFV